MDTKAKETRLNEALLSLDKVVVAFSGGVDSTFLAAAAKRVLGDKAVLATAYSPTSSEQEKRDTETLVDKLGMKHVWLPATELDNPLFIANTAERCYFCKKGRFGGLVAWAKEQGFAWVIEGTNADDLTDYRPGMKAIAELDAVKSPLLEAGFSKAEIRAVSREWDLPTWDKPSAACLVSRLAYGLEITPERLKQVDEAEQVVRQFIKGQVRVRHHGDLARVEVSPDGIGVLAQPDTAAAIASGLKKLGFTFVTLDLAGYRTGSMNEMLDEVQG
ncbi:MAG: ATP-dependent sacrificial sulfur transferase LarE [Negativicutes bacterium]|nr:ATP-dependent sacrificial sulfur transferase LarE [Negativicutes bacterium]